MHPEMNSSTWQCFDCGVTFTEETNTTFSTKTLTPFDLESLLTANES